MPAHVRSGRIQGSAPGPRNAEFWRSGAEHRLEVVFGKTPGVSMGLPLRPVVNEASRSAGQTDGEAWVLDDGALHQDLKMRKKVIYC